MPSKTTSLPDGFHDRSADWHVGKFIEFTRFKLEIGEPSPHLAIVGHMSQKSSMHDRLWLLGCYAATYCLPTAQAIWQNLDVDQVRHGQLNLEDWMVANWKGVITRQERRCVRTPAKMADCLGSYISWMDNEYPKILGLSTREKNPHKYYEIVWDSVDRIRYFGRYINIRLVEGLRRYCNIPASLYDIRSIGGWSPKKALSYFYPTDAHRLLVDDYDGNKLTNVRAYELLERVKQDLPYVDCYILAAMLCEYKGAFEKRHQFPGWTLSQEPELYQKCKPYWKDKLKDADFWQARADLFPHETLEEFNTWKGMRWPLTKTLRDHGYNWTDLLYDYSETEKKDCFDSPIKRLVPGTPINYEKLAAG